MTVFGCGSSSHSMTSGQSTTPAPQPSYSMNGNWDFLATSSKYAGVTLEMGGILTSTGNNVAGTLFVGNVKGASCFSLLQPVPVTGTISNSGSVTVASSAINNQIITFTGNLTAGGSSVTGATYSVSSGTGSTQGCAAGDQGNVAASVAFPLSSTYTGNITSQSTGDVFPATANILTQTATFDTAPYLTLAGTISVSGSSCFTKENLTPGLQAGGGVYNVVFGNELLFIVPVGGTASSQNIAIFATIANGGSVLNAEYAYGGGLCGDDIGAGTLTAQ